MSRPRRSALPGSCWDGRASRSAAASASRQDWLTSTPSWRSPGPPASSRSSNAYRRPMPASSATSGSKSRSIRTVSGPPASASTTSRSRAAWPRITAGTACAATSPTGTPSGRWWTDLTWTGIKAVFRCLQSARGLRLACHQQARAPLVPLSAGLPGGLRAAHQAQG